MEAHTASIVSVRAIKCRAFVTFAATVQPKRGMHRLRHAQLGHLMEARKPTHDRQLYICEIQIALSNAKLCFTGAARTVYF